MFSDFHKEVAHAKKKSLFVFYIAMLFVYRVTQWRATTVESLLCCHICFDKRTL